MDKNLITYLKLSKFKFGLLVVNAFLSVFYIVNGFINWSVYVLIFIAVLELIHVIDVVLQKSYLELDGNKITIHKWLRGTKVYDLDNYEDFKGRQRNGLILTLVATNPHDPKDYLVIFNLYKTALNEFYLRIADIKGIKDPEEDQVVLDAEISE